MKRHRIAWPPRRLHDQPGPGKPPPREGRARNPMIGLFGRTGPAEPAAGPLGGAMRPFAREAIR